VLTFCRATNLQAQEYSKLCSESLVRELFELAGHYVERGIFSRAAEPFAKHSQMILHTVLGKRPGHCRASAAGSGRKHHISKLRERQTSS